MTDANQPTQGLRNLGLRNLDLRDLGRVLATAPDSKLIAVLSVVDQLPDRGVTDALIAPLRPRLARLRPARALNFTRLLFMPLDMLIVTGPRWKGEETSLPRTALMPLAAMVRRELGPDGAVIDALIAGRFVHDQACVQAAGGLLWPKAAAALLRAPPPVDWAETGLPATVYAPLARRIGAVLAQMPGITDLVQDSALGMVPAGGDEEEDAIKAILAGVLAAFPTGVPMLVALLLALLPHLRPELNRVAERIGGPVVATVRKASEQVLTAAIDRLEAPDATEAELTKADLTEAGSVVRRIAMLLTEAEVPSLGKDQRARVQALRKRLDESCQTRFGEGLESELLAPMRTLKQPATALEQAARGLRELETEARLIGGGAIYDQKLKDAAAAVQAIGSASGTDTVDQCRLVEILAGPEAALAMLAAAGQR